MLLKFIFILFLIFNFTASTFAEKPSINCLSRDCAFNTIKCVIFGSGKSLKRLPLSNKLEKVNINNRKSLNVGSVTLLCESNSGFT